MRNGSITQRRFACKIRYPTTAFVKRRPLNILAAVSIALLTAVCVIWAVSYWRTLFLVHLNALSERSSSVLRWKRSLDCARWAGTCIFPHSGGAAEYSLDLRNLAGTQGLHAVARAIQASLPRRYPRCCEQFDPPASHDLAALGTVVGTHDRASMLASVPTRSCSPEGGRPMPFLWLRPARHARSLPGVRRCACEPSTIRAENA